MGIDDLKQLIREKSGELAGERTFSERLGTIKGILAGSPVHPEILPTIDNAILHDGFAVAPSEGSDPELQEVMKYIYYVAYTGKSE